MTANFRVSPISVLCMLYYVLVNIIYVQGENIKSKECNINENKECLPILSSLSTNHHTGSIKKRIDDQISSEQQKQDDLLLYLNIKSANRSESLNKIKNVPLVYYKFKYDTIPDRYQLGIIGPDAFKYFPESIEVVSSKTLFLKDRSSSTSSSGSRSNSSNSNNVNVSSSSSSSNNNNNIILTNFPVVDKNVLFMHGIVTLQELIYKYEELNNIIFTYDDYTQQLKKDIKNMLESINKDITKIDYEKLNMINLEKEKIQQEIILENEKINNEKLIIMKQMEEDKIQLEYEIELNQKKLLYNEEIVKLNNQEILNYEKEIMKQKDLYYQQSLLILSQTKEDENKIYENQKLIYEKNKIDIELQGKLKQIKIEQEIEIEKLQLQSKLDTERMINSIKTITLQINNILLQILSQPIQLLQFLFIILLLLFLYYIIKESIIILRKYIQSRLGKPSLVRETSYSYSILPIFIHNLFNKKDKILIKNDRIMLEKEFCDIILSDDDKERVVNLALATRNTLQSGAPYRHGK
jgi:ATPase family AAA domain-containing protein 3A/B